MEGPPKELFLYSRPVEIFRSWFWRFYDNLFHLIFYNLFWAFSCLGIGWLFARFNFFKITKEIDFISFLLIFIVGSIMSIGWAHLVFRIFIYGEGEIKDFWIGIEKYIFKATGVSIVSGIFIASTVFNIRFYFNLSIINNLHWFTDYLLMGLSFWILVFWLLGSIYYWPILFFQNPPFFKIFYKAFLLVVGNFLVSVEILAIYVIFIILFSFIWPLWFFVGGAFLFSLQCVTLEKQLLMYRITYRNKSLGTFLEILDSEQRRGWNEFYKPWENK